MYSLKNQKIGKKNKKKIIKQKVKNRNSNSVELFNKSSLEKKQLFSILSIIFNIIKKKPNCESIKILSDINDILLFLLRFSPKSDENYFQVSIEEGCKNLSQIHLSHSAMKLLFSKISFESSEFCEKLLKFDYISIELKYPDESFDNIYSQILNLKRINISIFISRINETDMKFQRNKSINSVIIGPPVTKVVEEI